MALYVPSGSAHEYNFEDGTNGGAYPLDTPSDVTSAPVVSSTNPIHGLLSLHSDGSTGYRYIQNNFGSAVTAILARFYMWSDTTSLGDIADYALSTSTTTSTTASRALQIRRNANNKLRIADATGATLWTATNALALSSVYCIVAYVSCGTSANATIKLAYFADGNNTAIETFSTAAATTPANINNWRLGKQTSAAWPTSTMITKWDDAGIDLAPNTYNTGDIWLPPSGRPIPPRVYNRAAMVRGSTR